MNYEQIKTIIETYTACVNAAYSNTYYTTTIDARISDAFLTYLKEKIMELGAQFDYTFGRKDCGCLWFDSCHCDHVYTIFINKNHLLMNQVLLDDSVAKSNDESQYVCEETDFDSFIVTDIFYKSNPSSPRNLSNDLDLISM